MKCPLQADLSPVFHASHMKFGWRDDGTCEYCGSISPALFWRAVADNCELVPTDKGYKVYVQGEKAPTTKGACKFYFEHFSEEDQAWFIDRLNLNQLNIVGGGFYVLPFFVGANNDN